MTMQHTTQVRESFAAMPSEKKSAKVWRTVWGLVIVAFSLVTVYALGLSGTLRRALVVYFAGGLLAWLGYALWPGWTTWGAYQGTRAAGITLFCLAMWRDRDR